FFKRGAAIAMSSDNGGNASGAVGAQVEVAPIDSKIIPAFRENGLFAGARAQDRLAIEDIAAPPNGLVGRVHHQIGAGIEIQGNLVGLSVRGRNAPLNVCCRAGEYVQVIGQGRREESERQLYASASEIVDRSSRQNVEASLL